MKLTTFVPLLLAAASGSALAQPGTAPTEDPSLTTPTPEEPAAPQPPPPPPAPPATVQPTADASADGRPVGMSLGLGVGYVFGGANLQQPNIASARLRLASGLTFEPSVVLGTERQHAGATDTTDSTLELTVGTGIRYPLYRKGKFDLELLGLAGISVVGTNPNGDGNNTTMTHFELGWGAAIGYWLTPHFDFTVGASNALFSYTNTKPEGADSGDSRLAFLAEWNPSVSAMIHLFY